MKKNLVPIIVVVVLFACVAVVSFASKGSDGGSSKSEGANGTVKICPHSGLPCEGDGDCGEDCDGEGCEESCDAQ